MFLTRYENDSSERRQLLEQLNDGEYPSLNWMCKNPLVDASIPPGLRKWKPTDIYGTPPVALPRARPSAWKDDMNEALRKFLAALDDTVRPQATALNFFRIDSTDTDKRYEIPVPPLYIRRSFEGDGEGVGVDLLYQTRYLAENKIGVPLFTANLQQYQQELCDGTMKIITNSTVVNTNRVYLKRFVLVIS